MTNGILVYNSMFDRERKKNKLLNFKLKKVKENKMFNFS